MGALYTQLAQMLGSQDAHHPEVITVRADLARACARAGQLEDALYQADELVKDCRRELGEDHELTLAAQTAQDEVQTIVDAALAEQNAAGGE
jgi:hypothetical protein